MPVPTRLMMTAQTPAALEALLKHAYQQLQGSNLPTLTSSSSDALEVILSEVRAAKPQGEPASTPVPDTDQPDLEASEFGDLQEQLKGPDDFMGNAEEEEEFYEGSDRPPNPGDDPNDYIQPRHAKQARTTLPLSSSAIRKTLASSSVGRSFGPPAAAPKVSPSSHRGPGGNFAALRAAQLEERKKHQIASGQSG